MSAESETSCVVTSGKKNSTDHAVTVVSATPSTGSHATPDDLSFLHDLLRKLSTVNDDGDDQKDGTASETEITWMHARIMTLIRRSLRNPLLRDNGDEFPPSAVALCAVTYVFQTPVSKVYFCYEKLLRERVCNSSTLANKTILPFHAVEKVYQRAWLQLINSRKENKPSNLAGPVQSPSTSKTDSKASPSALPKATDNGKNDDHIRGSDAKATFVNELTPTTTPNDALNAKSRLHLNSHIVKTLTTPVTPRTPETKDEKGSCEDSGVFGRMHIILVTSPRLTPRTAALLKSGVEAQCGCAELVPARDATPEKLAELTQSVYPRITTVVSDAAFITRHIKLCDKGDGEVQRMEETPDKHSTRYYDILSQKWLSDSIRAKRIKSREVYTNTPPPKGMPPKSPHSLKSPCVIKSICQTSIESADSSLRNKRVTDLRAEVNLSADESPSLNKRIRTNETTTSVAVRLFETPSSTKKKSMCRWSSDENHEKDDGKMTRVEKRFNMGPQWACEVRVGGSRSHFGDFPNNERICEQLEIVLTSYEARRDKFRSIGYSKAIARIKALDFDVEDVNDVTRLRRESNIGDRIADKVEEIVKTGTLRQAQEVLKNADFNSLQDLCAVWGVGPVKALALLTRGIRNITDLRKAVSKEPSLLDRCQTIGMRRYEDLRERLSRPYVAELEMYARRVVKGIDELLDITVAGSYIRGKESCGDVDILIHGDGRRVRNAFDKVKQAMRKSGVLTDDLVDGSGKYFGVFRLPGRKHGRVDLFAVPNEEFPYALLTYTGSAIFNRSMRAKAKALGYSLSHHGLQRVNRNALGKTRVEPSVVVQHERDIFRLLDIPYVPPCERSIS